MQGIYTYIPETNYVPREYSVAAILLLLFMVLISSVSVFNLLYFYNRKLRFHYNTAKMAGTLHEEICKFVIICDNVSLSSS